MLKWLIPLVLWPGMLCAQYFHEIPDCFEPRPPVRYEISRQPGVSYQYSILGGGIVDQAVDAVVVDWQTSGRLTVTATNEWDCTTEFSLIMQLVPCDQSLLWVPNSFTPNQNGLNDRFTPKGVNIAQYQMSIFNRWGEEIYFTRNIDQGWDGLYAGRLCRPGVYSYKITYQDHEGYFKTMVGMVTLLR